MRQLLFKKRGRARLIPSASAFSIQIRPGVKRLKALPRILAKALRQPSIQYRIALLLATLLAALIGWTTFLSTFPHAGTVAFIGRFSRGKGHDRWDKR
jgi:hypothetical protein